MYRFTNLTDLNLTKNEISYIEDGAFAGQANLQVGNQQQNLDYYYLFLACTPLFGKIFFAALFIQQLAESKLLANYSTCTVHVIKHDWSMQFQLEGYKDM